MKKLFAIILAMLMVLSLAACANKDVDSNESGSDTNDTQNQTESSEKATEGKKDDDADKLPETDDEILAYVLNALSATEAYKGDLTLKGASGDTVIMKSAPEAEGGEETVLKNISSETSLATLDAANKVIYYDSISEYNPGEDSTDADAEKTAYFSKSFFNNNTLYTASKYITADSEEASEVDFNIIHDNSVERYSSLNDLEFLAYPKEVYSGIKLAETFAEVKEAFKTALPSVLANMMGEEMENAAPTVTSDVSVKIVDGVCTLIISIKSSATSTTEEEGVSTNMTMLIDIYHEISAKDGKIIDFKSKIDMAQKATMGETSIQDYSQSFYFNLGFEYSFAKEKYDSFEVTLPEDTSDIRVIGAPAEDYGDLDILLYINGVKAFDDISFECETPEEALSAITAYVDAERANVKVFSDEAMTKELLADTVTKEDILALEKVYLSVTPKADYALVMSDYTERNDYSKAYNIVIPTLYFLSSSSETWNDPASLLEPGEFGLDEKYVEDENCEIWINGVKLEAKTATITIEAGKTYNIEYVTVLSDKDFVKA